MQLPGWFRALLVLVLLMLCVETCWYAITMQQLTATQMELSAQLETSRQRERKQQYEYDVVCKALPQAREELALIQPQADAAKAHEQELRDTRKALRQEIAALKKQLEEAQASPEESMPD